MSKIIFTGLEAGSCITLTLNDIYRLLKQQSKFLVLTSNSSSYTDNLLKLFEEVFASNFPGDILHIQSDTDRRIMSDFERLAKKTGFPNLDNVDIYYIFDVIQYYYFTGGLFVFHEASSKSKIIYTLSQYVHLSKDVKFIIGSDSSEWDPRYFRVLWVDKWEFKEEFSPLTSVNYSGLSDKEYFNQIWIDRSVLISTNVEDYLHKFISGFKRRNIRRKGNIRFNVILP